MTDQSIMRKPAPLCVTQFNAKAEGKDVVLSFSFHNMHVWKDVFDRVQAMNQLGWEVDEEKSRNGSHLEVRVSGLSVSAVVDRVHGMNIQSLRPAI